MNFNFSEPIDRELEITQEVLSRYEYPTYREVQEMTEGLFQIDPDRQSDDFVDYECMTTVCHNIFDVHVVKWMGADIEDRRGFESMQANYYMFLHVFRDELRDPEIVIAWRMVKELINDAWDGVGDWRM
jgi:hypothetical protein